MRSPPSPSRSLAAVSAAAATAGGGGAKTPCCSKVGLKRGPWTPEEDELLANYIKREGEGKWRTLPKRAGLLRCGKSCRLRWMNYLRPSVKRGHIAPDEEDLILRLHRLLGNRWSLIAGRIPGRTDNEIKNYWNTHLSKKLISQGIDPRTHKPLHDVQVDNNNKNHHNHKGLSPSSSNPSALSNPNPVHSHILPSYISDDSNSGVGAADGRDPDTPPSTQTAPPFHIKVNTTTTSFRTDPTRNHQNLTTNGSILPSTSSINANHHLSFEPSFPVTSNNKDNNDACGESPASLEDQNDDPNYCTDEVFSSFLNSLINEDIFTSQSQQQLPHYDALITQPTSNSTALAFGAAGWDAPPLMSATTTASAAAAFHHNPSADQPR